MSPAQLNFDHTSGGPSKSAINLGPAEANWAPLARAPNKQAALSSLTTAGRPPDQKQAGRQATIGPRSLAAELARIGPSPAERAL